MSLLPEFICLSENFIRAYDAAEIIFTVGNEYGHMFHKTNIAFIPVQINLSECLFYTYRKLATVCNFVS